jgi:uncharacterized protein (TIGR02996 family)
MTDQQALLAAILDNPGDDVCRLVYADWLEENQTDKCRYCFGSCQDRSPQAVKDKNGSIWVYKGPVGPCPLCEGRGQKPNGNAERAEFIRVQCELTKPTLGPDGTGDSGARYKLVRREKDLLSHNWVLWADPIVTAFCANLYPHDTRGLGVVIEFRRGFIRHVSGPFGLLRTHLPAIVRQHPLEANAEMVTDREPFDSAAGWRWVGDHECRWNENEDSRIDTRIYWLCRNIYPTREAARLALAVALIAEAKAAEQDPRTKLLMEVASLYSLPNHLL